MSYIKSTGYLPKIELIAHVENRTQVSTLSQVNGRGGLYACIYRLCGGLDVIVGAFATQSASTRA